MARTSNPPQLADQVRQRLRDLRRQRGISLQEAANRARMDPSTLSRLESGARRLAIDHLPGLANALGVTLDELLSPTRSTDPRVRARPRTVDGMTVWPLTRHGAAAGLRAFKLAIPPDRHPEQRSHDGYEWIYILAGRVRLLLGDDELELEAGDAAEFSTWTPHWVGADRRPAEVLAIFGAQGERVHLRSSP